MYKNFTSPPDRFFINGERKNVTNGILDPLVDVNGATYWDEDKMQLSYLGKKESNHISQPLLILVNCADTP